MVFIVVRYEWDSRDLPHADVYMVDAGEAHEKVIEVSAMVADYLFDIGSQSPYDIRIIWSALDLGTHIVAGYGHG